MNNDDDDDMMSGKNKLQKRKKLIHDFINYLINLHQCYYTNNGLI